MRATDVAGNVDASPASFVFTVDTTSANTTITSSPPAASSSASASFSFTASDAGPGFECRLDGGAFADCSSPKSYTGLSEAAHTFEVRAEDAAGNLDPTPATYAWTVDQTAPNTSFLSTPSNPSANPTPTFGLGSTETPSTFECDLDGGGWASCSTPFTTPALGDGSHTLKARATDAAGNTDASEITFTWLVDATAPTGSITSPANGADVGGTIVLASDSADAGGSGVATVVFQRSPVGAGTWTNQPASWDTTAQADGDYDLRVVTTDGAGNSFTSPLITVTIDNTDPSLSVVAPNPVNLATADPATVSATATDAGSGVANVRFDQCAEDSPACVSDSWVLLGIDTGAPYQASWPIPSDGPRLLRVRATDNAGKQKTELVLITIDRIRPTGSLTAPAAGANLRGASVALSATASDTAPGSVNTVTFQRSPAGAGTWSDVAVDAAAPYAATLDTTALADGLYDLRVFTTDAAGNAESTPATIQVRVDNTLPTGSVTAPASGANLRGTVALTSNSADGGSGVDTVVFQRSPAGAGTWTNQAASWDTTLAADGQYDLRVVTTDNAGNAFTSAAITIRVDNTNPTGDVTAPAAGANVRGTIALASDSADAGSGVATTQFQRSPAGAGTWTNQAASWNTTLQADGQYDIRVVTTDNAGNAFTSATVTIRVDNTAPTGTVTAPANGAEIGIPPVALTSNSADAGSGVATVVFERSPAGAGSWSPTPASWNTASGPDAVADGEYDLRVTTTDNAGNAFTSAAITVKVDHTAPVTSASLAPGSPSNSPVTVTFTAGDGTGSGVSATSYSIDGGSVQTGNSAIVSAPGDHSNDGAHVVQYFSTDDVGNVETPKTVTVVIDTTAPSGAPGDPGTYLRGIANLTYSTADGDVSSVQFQFSPAGAGAWSNIGSADLTPPYDAAWNTVLVADGPYDLRAVVTDTTGNVANELLPGLPKTVDNTAPSGSVTSPAAGALVSGTLNVTATATDGAVPPASGVSAVRFELQPSGSGSFIVFGTQNAPVVGSTYQQSLATTAYPDGPADLRVVVTDVAGNETTSTVRTVTLDNVAPTITLNDPGAAVSGTVSLGVTTAADTAQVVFERSPAGAGTWTTIATDSTPGDGFTAAFDTTALADGVYDLRARATDGGGNPGTSAQRTTRLDNTLPTGSVTAPGAGATVGGPAVQLAATGTDGGAGVVSVAFEIKPFGAGAFTGVGSDTTAPYALTWDSTSAPDGVAEIRAVVTDAAGNVYTTTAVSATVDSTGPSVTLTDPGSVVSGTVGLSAVTGGGAVRVSFGVSPAGSGTWTEIASDTSAPFAADLDTSTLADGLYDLRAIGYDSLGNPSTPSVRASVRFDNTAPSLLSSAPADGSVSMSANQIVLTASEAVLAPGALLDGAPAPAPTVSGNQLTFATGALADGLHVLSGELEDAGGIRTPFRVAVTIESTPAPDRPPVEKSASPTAMTTLEAPGQLATVRLPASAWPAIPGAKDFLVLRVDPTLPSAALASRLAPGSHVIEVTARWALAGTDVHDFEDVLEVLLPASTGANGVPMTSQDGMTWRTLPLLDGPTLTAGRADGFYRDADGVHVLTRHLSYFALFADGEAPTPPRDVAGVVAEDGLTLRWVPGTDDSGELGSVVLLVNGEPYASFDPTQFEVKLGAFLPGDTRIFSFLQYDAAGNVSVPSQSLRAVPTVAGLDTNAAAARLAAAGFALGKVERTLATDVPAGLVVAPAKLLLATVGSSIDVVASGGAPQTQFVLRIASDRIVKVQIGRLASIPVRVFSTQRASGTATLATASGRRLYSWRFQLKSGVTIKKLRLPSQVRRPGYYRLTWSARAGSATARQAVRIRFVGPGLEQLRTRPHRVEVVLAVDTSRGARTISSSADRVVSHATPERTFALLSATDRTVRVVVVDVDRFGIQFLRDVRTVFPTVRVIALSEHRVRWASIERAGAHSILPRSATTAQLGRAIRRASVTLPTR